jgi:hypothetical protein
MSPKIPPGAAQTRGPYPQRTVASTEVASVVEFHVSAAFVVGYRTDCSVRRPCFGPHCEALVDRSEPQWDVLVGRVVAVDRFTQ